MDDNCGSPPQILFSMNIQEPSDEHEQEVIPFQIPLYHAQHDDQSSNQFIGHRLSLDSLAGDEISPSNRMQLSLAKPVPRPHNIPYVYLVIELRLSMRFLIH